MNEYDKINSLTKEELEKMVKSNKLGSKKDLIEALGLPYNYITIGLIVGLLEKHDLLTEDKQLELLRIETNPKEAKEILLFAKNMGITIEKPEIELNRAWIYDNEDEEVIGETNFVIKEHYLEEILPQITDLSLEEFLDIYEPETDGEKIYQMALENNQLIEDMGVVLY